MSLLQLSYTSQVRSPLTPEGYDDLLTSARRRNCQDSITGLLAYDGARFLQAIEGPDGAVRECMNRISRDDRHQAIVMLRQIRTDDREFGSFAMAGVVPGTAHRDLLDEIKNLVDAVTSSHLKAMFIGFGMLARQKAPLQT